MERTTKQNLVVPLRIYTLEAGTAAVVVVAAVLQHEVFLLSLGKCSAETIGFLILQKLTGCCALSCDGLLQFASLHRGVVVELTEVLIDGICYRRESALRFAAAISNQGHEIALSKLCLVSHGVDRGIDPGKLIAKVHVEITQSVTDAVDVLRDKVETGFIAGSCGRVIYGEISSEVAVTATFASASVSAAAKASAESAPTEEQEPRQKRPHTIHASPAASASAIHEGDCFPGIRVAVGTSSDRIDVVDRYCFHFLFLSFWLLISLVFEVRKENTF